METRSATMNGFAGRLDFSAYPLSPVEKGDRTSVLLRRLQEAMSYAPDFPKACLSILDTILEEMEIENCSLMLREPSSGELLIRAAGGRNEGKSIYYPESSGQGKGGFRPGQGIAGRVLEEGQAAMVRDAQDDPRFLRVAGLNNRVRSLMCFPIRDEDRVIGVFNLSHSRPGIFSEEMRAALSLVATQLSAALSSARLSRNVTGRDRCLQGGGELRPTMIPGSLFVPSDPPDTAETVLENGIFLFAHEKMRRIKEIIDQVANSEVTVLIQGESGVGKEVVARSIHLHSNRQENPFVKVNCAALPQELLESELFGYEKGAFTGAYRQKPGKFELAHEGTIFLDEIGEISPALQAKLLQVLQDRQFSRLGGKKDVWVDVRVIVATNQNLEGAVRDGRFREDLYYRLNVVSLTIPPLRERVEEIPLFVDYFLRRYRGKTNHPERTISEALMRAFLQHPWMGNIRELENIIQRYLVLGNEEEIIRELTSASEGRIGRNGSEARREPWPSLQGVHREAIRQAEREVIQQALEKTNWNRKKAALALNISYKALLYKIKKCGLNT